jgi:leucyl-tRNA synthetase
MGPLDAVKYWKTSGVEGLYRFLNRAWRMIVDKDGGAGGVAADAPLSREQERLLHVTIKKVTDDLEALAFNTAISQLMIFVNEFSRTEPRNRHAMETFVLLLSPMAPHIAEELWQRLGHAESLAAESWPAYAPTLLLADQVEIVVQVCGKVRARMSVPADADEARLRDLALGNARVAEAIAGKTIVKTVVVPGRLVNVVAR